MTETSRLIPVRVLAVLALAVVACNVDAANQIPCADDFSCPNDYPVCAAGKCIAGTSTLRASVAVVGADGHASTDFLSGTVRVLVSARASSGVQSVTLAAGSTTFNASSTAATLPLYAFDVDTTTLADGDRQLTATLTAGDGTTASASGTLHVDNAKPVITSFTVAGGPSTTITAGATATISASFTGGVSATVSDGTANVSIANGVSLLVGPDVLTTYTLRVTSRSGVSVQSGATGQPPNVSVAVVQPTSFTGNFTVSPTAIEQNASPTGNLTFTAPTVGASVVSAVVMKDSTQVGTIDLTAPPPRTVQVPVPATTSTASLTYTLVLKNGASSPDAVSIPVIVQVGAKPSISTFTGGTTITAGRSATLQATFSGGNGSINGIPVNSGGSVTVAPTSTTTYDLVVTNPVTGNSVSSAATAQSQTVTVVAPPLITEFTSSNVHVTSGDAIPLSIKTTGVTGDAPVTVTCTPQGSLAPFTITLSGGNGSSVPNPTAPTVTQTSTCTFTATVQNAASTSVFGRVVVTVEPAPTITANSFVFAVTGNSTAFFARGDTVTLNHAYNAFGGTATINGTPAGTTSTTFSDIQFDTLYTLSVTNLSGKTATATAMATIAPGSWFLLNQNSTQARQGVTVTALDNGKVLIAGGTSEPGATPLKTAVVCDVTGTCTSAGTMNVARAFHTAVKIPAGAPNNAGKVLLAGGYTAAGLTSPTPTAEFYDPATSSFASTTDITTGTVMDARARHVAVVLDSRHVLIAGGTNGTANLANAVNYDAGAATPTVANTGAMARARASFTGTLLLTGKVLVVGGNPGNDVAELYDPAGTGTFSDTGEVSTTSVEDKRAHTAVLISGLNAGRVLVSGGVTGAGSGTVSATQFVYDPVSATFSPAPAMRTARSSHAAIVLSNNNILLCGGTSGSATLASCERYDPDTGNQRPTASMLEPRKNFGMAPLGSTVLEVLSSGGTDAGSTTTAETYNAN